VSRIAVGAGLATAGYAVANVIGCTIVETAIGPKDRRFRLRRA
jgi:hypothetical protein